MTGHPKASQWSFKKKKNKIQGGRGRNFGRWTPETRGVSLPGVCFFGVRGAVLPRPEDRGEPPSLHELDACNGGLCSASVGRGPPRAPARPAAHPHRPPPPPRPPTCAASPPAPQPCHHRTALHCHPPTHSHPQISPPSTIASSSSSPGRHSTLDRTSVPVCLRFALYHFAPYRKYCQLAPFHLSTNATCAESSSWENHTIRSCLIWWSV